MASDKPAGILALLMKGKGSPESDEDDGEDMPDGKRQAFDEMLDARKAEDADAEFEALRSLVEMCVAEYSSGDEEE